MDYNKLKKTIKDDKFYSRFIAKRLDISEKFEFAKNKLPYMSYRNALAYTLSKGEIWMDEKAKELLYYICNDDKFKKLKEGAKFIIMHEIGHFHDFDGKNMKVKNYLDEILEVLPQECNPTNCFPESEATRYALQKSKNYVESIAGFTAINAFLYNSKIKESLNEIEKHFSFDYEIKDCKNEYEKLRKISSFKLSKENREKIEKTADYYNKLLKDNLKISFLKHIYYKVSTDNV